MPKKVAKKSAIEKQFLEGFCQNISLGMAEGQAYQMALGKEVPQSTAIKDAKRLLARPDVKARLKQIQMQQEEEESSDKTWLIKKAHKFLREARTDTARKQYLDFIAKLEGHLRDSASGGEGYERVSSMSTQDLWTAVREIMDKPMPQPPQEQAFVMAPQTEGTKNEDGLAPAFEGFAPEEDEEGSVSEEDQDYSADESERDVPSGPLIKI